jgi:hypothetical protein
MRNYRLIIALLGLLLAGCGSTPELTATFIPTVSAATTRAPTATTTAVPSETALPAATASQTTAPASATPSPQPPTATATSQAIDPLTGLPVADPAVLDRRPLAIKVAHFPQHVRLAQVGLSMADNVWEHYAEGGTTRFTAIFLSQSPERVGNVRSARLIDTYLGQAYQAMLVASGSSSGTMFRLKQTDFFNRVIAEATGYKGCPILCREAPASETTDKLYTSPAAVWALADTLGLGGKQNLDGYVFDEAVPAGGTTINTVRIDWQVNRTVAEWRYDPATKLYARWIDTFNMPELAPHVDTLNGQALAAADVVVVYAEYLVSNIHESDSGGKLYFSYDIELYGSGRARLFRDGQMYELTWTRDAEQGGLPRFTDAGGNPIAFRPGQVWFEAVSTISNDKVDGDLFTVRVRVPDASAAATAMPGPTTQPANTAEPAATDQPPATAAP